MHVFKYIDYVVKLFGNLLIKQSIELYKALIYFTIQEFFA